MNPNDDLDRTIQEALHREAARPMPTPDLDDVRRRAEEGQRRPRWLPAAAAVVVLLALVVGAFAVGGGSGDDTNVTTDPDPSSTSVPEPDGPTTTDDDPVTSTETTTPAGPDITATTGEDFGGIEVPRGEPMPPGQFIGTLARELPDRELPSLDIARFDADGRVLETLEEGFGSPAEGGTYGYELSPDRRTVYFVSSDAACISSIWAVPADGSSEPIRVSDRAHGVAVSPDGSRLALMAGDICDHPDAEPAAVEIVPVTGGPTQRFVLDDDAGAPSSSVWVDDTSVVVSIVGDEPALYDVDPAAGTGRRVEPEPRTSIVELTAGSDGRAVGAETTGAAFEPGELRIVRYDDGTISEVFDSSPLPAGSLTDLDVLADGRISAIVVTEDAGRAWYLDGRLLRDDVFDVAS